MSPLKVSNATHVLARAGLATANEAFDVVCTIETLLVG